MPSVQAVHNKVMAVITSQCSQWVGGGRRYQPVYCPGGGGGHVRVWGSLGVKNNEKATVECRRRKGWGV